MKAVMKALNRSIVVSYDILERCAAIVLLSTILFTTTGIIFRYILNNSLSWVEELCSFLLIWLAYLSAGLATVSKSHIVADFLSRLLKGNAQKILSWVIRVLEIVFFVFIMIAALKLFPTLRMRSSALEIPRQWYYVPIIGMSGYMIAAIVIDMLNELFPGYNAWRVRQDERDRILAAEEEALQKESLESVKEFMDETEDAQQ